MRPADLLNVYFILLFLYFWYYLISSQDSIYNFILLFLHFWYYLIPSKDVMNIYKFYAKGQEESPILVYSVVCIFRAKMRYVILRGTTKSLISGRMDVENNIFTVIFQILTRQTFHPQFWCFCLLLFLTLIGFLCYSSWRVTCLFFFFLSCYVSFLSLKSAFLLVDWCVCWTAFGGFLVHHTHHSEGKICGDRVNLICSSINVCGIRLLAHIAHCYGWYCVMNGYCKTKGI